MSIGVSVFHLVVGAILTFAVNVSASGFNINTVGIILISPVRLDCFSRCYSGAVSRRGAVAGPWRAETR
jgi:hypothetical protein